jgi:uncharacterized membrane protein
MDRAAPPAEKGLAKSCIEALSDGVFAIAMTLMIFSNKVPEILTERVRAALARVCVRDDLESLRSNNFLIGRTWTTTQQLPKCGFRKTLS